MRAGREAPDVQTTSKARTARVSSKSGRGREGPEAATLAQERAAEALPDRLPEARRSGAVRIELHVVLRDGADPRFHAPMGEELFWLPPPESSAADE
jgi:hypothetical protein